LGCLGASWFFILLVIVDGAGDEVGFLTVCSLLSVFDHIVVIGDGVEGGVFHRLLVVERFC
jgi:hypothetical protein